MGERPVALPDLDKAVLLRGFDVLIRIHVLAFGLGQQCGVAQVVGHHNGRIQRRKVQRGNRPVIES